jgi:uncharacterized protein
VTAAHESCLYVGWVRHRRHEPLSHRLQMALFMAYLDLDELPELFDGYRFASARSRALAEFRRSDHLGDPERPLADEIRALVATRSGAAPTGPVRLLTSLRQFGHAFNPVSLYYCFDAAAARVEAVVAEVTNTPWGETHAYVLSPAGSRGQRRVLSGRVEKAFHVSPFMGMDHAYAWRLTEPGDQLIVHIDSEREQRVVFDATLSMRRRALTPTSLHLALLGHPLLTVRIVSRIYAHGARLWLRGARYFPNPSGAPALGAARRAHASRSRRSAGP